MQTAFKEIPLDEIRYSLVWEDYTVLDKAFQPKRNDVLAIITSAGCNVLNACLSDVSHIYAVDLNARQNELLRFKMYVIREFPYEVWEELMGFCGTQRAEERASWLLTRIPESYRHILAVDRTYGLLGSGRLERYILGFLKQHPEHAEFIRSLIFLPSADERGKALAGYPGLLHLQRDFCTWFSEANLSKGRDPRLFRHVGDNRDQAFWLRLKKFLEHREGELPFIFRFFFFGPDGIPMELRPPVYQKDNYERLGKRLEKIQCIDGEMMQFLDSPAAETVTLCSLSNIFEYCSADEFRFQLTHFLSKKRGPLRLVYWNLLQDQFLDDFCYKENMSEILSDTEACFYFLNLKFYQK